MTKGNLAFAVGLAFMLSACEHGSKTATQNLENAAGNASNAMEQIADEEPNAEQANILVNESLNLSNAQRAAKKAAVVSDRKR